MFLPSLSLASPCRDFISVQWDFFLSLFRYYSVDGSVIWVGFYLPWMTVIRSVVEVIVVVLVVMAVVLVAFCSGCGDIA